MFLHVVTLMAEPGSEDGKYKTMASVFKKFKSVTKKATSSQTKTETSSNHKSSSFQDLYRRSATTDRKGRSNTLSSTVQGRNSFDSSTSECPKHSGSHTLRPSRANSERQQHTKSWIENPTVSEAVPSATPVRQL